MHSSVNEYYGDEVDYDRKQSAQLWKFTAVNVRIINELKVSVPGCPTWCLNMKGLNKVKYSCPRIHNISVLRCMHVIIGWKGVCFNTWGIIVLHNKSFCFKLCKGLAVEKSLQLCICPFQGASQTVGTRWIMDVVVMIALKCGEKEKKSWEFFLNQVKCLNWSYFVYRWAPSLEIPTVNTTLVCSLTSTNSKSVQAWNPQILVQTFTVTHMPVCKLFCGFQGSSVFIVIIILLGL